MRSSGCPHGQGEGMGIFQDLDEASFFYRSGLEGFDFILHLVRVVRCKFGFPPGFNPFLSMLDGKIFKIRRKKPGSFPVDHLGRDKFLVASSSGDLSRPSDFRDIQVSNPL